MHMHDSLYKMTYQDRTALSAKQCGGIAHRTPSHSDKSPETLLPSLKTSPPQLHGLTMII